MKHTIIDMIGRGVELISPPRRIVSLVPSQTELLHYLGLEDQVAGITRFCTKPGHWSSSKTIIGGTKSIDIEKIHHLSPDLIIGNKEENVAEQITLLELNHPVWISDIGNLQDAKHMILDIGYITDRRAVAGDLVNQIEQRFQRMRERTAELPTPTAAYVVWKSPYMVAGNDTFIDDMLRWCGIRNCFSDRSRYPIVTADELKERKPDFILFSSEPFPFNQPRVGQEQINFPDSTCMLVDGEYFSWYGSRLLHTPDYLTGLMDRMQGKTDK